MKDRNASKKRSHAKSPSRRDETLENLMNCEIINKCLCGLTRKGMLLMEKYLIALDLDGSLLNKEGELSPLTIKVVQTLKSLGHKIVLATGRPFSGAIGKYQQLGLDTALVTDNGGSIEHPNDLTFPKQKTYIPMDMMHQLFNHVKPYIISSFFSIDEIVYAYQYEPKLEHYFSGVNSGNVIHGELSSFNIEPTGLVFLIHYDKQEPFESYIRDTFGHTLSQRLWGTDDVAAIYEVYLKHISKASALKYLLNHYEIDPSRWIAFGDGINDVEMIRDAAIGVAMKNCVPELRPVCKDMTDYTHDEEGIAQYLIKFFDLKEFL